MSLEHPLSEKPSEGLRFCEHFELLGVSPAIQPDHDSADIIHCHLCRLSFCFVTEGSRVIVSAIRPLGAGFQGMDKKG
jgi:hypothetical protein